MATNPDDPDDFRRVFALALQSRIALVEEALFDSFPWAKRFHQILTSDWTGFAVDLAQTDTGLATGFPNKRARG